MHWRAVLSSSWPAQGRERVLPLCLPPTTDASKGARQHGAAVPLDLASKHRSIAAALSLVAHNADMLDSIRGVLGRSRVPVIGPLPDRASQRRET